MPKKRKLMSLAYVILYMIVFYGNIVIVQMFQFSPPSVTAIPLTINAIAVYQISLDRSYTLDLVETRWASEVVPATNTIKLQFPSQYSFGPGKEPKLDSIIIDGLQVTTATMTRTDAQTVVISNAILTDTFISNIFLQLSNILNPSPAITTQTFKAWIGSDFTSPGGSSNSIITLTADEFKACGVTFSPAFVNTTGDMVVSIEPKTAIPVTGRIEIEFPTLLQWTDDISTNHPLPVENVNQCSISSTQATSVSCSGSRSSRSVSVSLNSATIPLTKPFTLTIKNLFSPPATNPLDKLTISSFTSQLYSLDTCQSSIFSLQPQPFTLIIEPSTSPLYIDTFTTPSFNFTNPDTIAKDDFFQLTFPTPTTITYVRSMSNLAINAGNYTPSNLTIKWGLLSSASNTFALTNNYIKFLNYKAPLTTKETGDIVLTVYNWAGRKKMEGKARIKAVQRQFTILGTVADLYGVNDVAQYTLTINIANAVTASAMLKLTLPSQLAFMTPLSCPLISGTTQVTICTQLNSSSVLIKGLWTTTPTGQQKLQLPAIVNPSYSVKLSAFKLQLYYNQSQEYLVADYTSPTSDAIMIQAKKLDPSKVSITLSNYSVAVTGVSYHVSFLVGNALPANSIIELSFPTTPTFIFTPPNTPTCSLTLNSINTQQQCTPDTTLKTVKLAVSKALTANSLVNVTVENCCSNPYSTRPVSFVGIKTFTANNSLVEYLQNPMEINGFKEVEVRVQQVVRKSDRNSEVNVWNVTVEHAQPIDQALSVIQLSFLPTTWTPLKSLTQVNITANSATSLAAFKLPTTPPNTLHITIPSTLTNQKTFTLTLSSITNPPTFQPLSYTIKTRTSDNFTYATSTFTLNPTTLPSAFSVVTYSFSSKILGSVSKLSLNITSLEENALEISRFTISNLNQYMQHSNTIGCDPALGLVCTLSSDKNVLTVTNANLSQVFANPYQLTLLDFYIRTGTNFTSMTLESYSVAGFKASEFKKIDFGPTCTMPCKECVSETELAKCTSCFDDPTVSKNKSLLGFKCYETCPSGYIQSINSNLTYPNICEPCSTQCLTCKTTTSTCLSCNTSSMYKYLHNQSCLKQCPKTTFPSSSESNSSVLTCSLCVEPCAECTSLTVCVTCLPAYFSYGTQCLGQCPLKTTVADSSAMICRNCAAQCKYCENQIDECTECATLNNKTLLFVADTGQCLATCPSDRVIDVTGKNCVFCKDPCATCSIIQTNCTSCLPGTFLSSQTPNTCLSTCQPLSIPNLTSNTCQLCTSLPSLHCKNCSSLTTCNQCDRFSGYVFFPSNSSCLVATPSGYVNISGVATKCDQTCKQCSITTTNCTSCEGNLFLVNNSCQTTCPEGFVPVNNTCVPCEGGCKLCSMLPTNCTLCYNVYYFISTQQQNQCLIKCPDQYFHSSYNITEAGKTCIKCQLPCLTCQNLTYCLSCVQGYSYQGQCKASCPNTTAQLQSPSKICSQCAPPCLTCLNQTYQCTSCSPQYYLFQPHNRCYLPTQCPVNISLPNPQTQTCQPCQPPCLTCYTTVTQCLTCLQTFFQYANQCLSQCPQGSFSASALCLNCPTQCSTCTSVDSCMACAVGYYLYVGKCVRECPVSYSIIINQTCTPCQQSCLNCSSQNLCYDCNPSFILYNGTCLSTCPQNLTEFISPLTTLRQCLTVEQIAEQHLSETLSSSIPFESILPLPFTIVASLLFVAAIMSRIQYEHTYMIGWAYVVFGLGEVGSLAYFGYKFWEMAINHEEVKGDGQYWLMLYLLVGCAGFILLLNCFSCTCGSYYLSQDQQFAKWMAVRRHKPIQSTRQQQSNHNLQSQAQPQPQPQRAQRICCQPMTSHIVFTIFSLITTFKLRMILFTNLFDLIFLSARLEDIQKFRIFNCLTFLGFLYEGVSIFVLYKHLTVYENRFPKEMLMVTVDALAMVVVNVVVGLVGVNKGEDFFVRGNEVQQDYKGDKDIKDTKQSIDDTTQHNISQNSLRQQSKQKPKPSSNKIANSHYFTQKSKPKSKNLPPLSSTRKQLTDKKQPELFQSKKVKSVHHQVKDGKIVEIDVEGQDSSGIMVGNDEVREGNENRDSKIKVSKGDQLQVEKKNYYFAQSTGKDQINLKPTFSKVLKPQNLAQPYKSSPQFNIAKSSKPKLLSHNILSTRKSQAQSDFRPVTSQKTENWCPKIPQVKVRRQHLSRMDLIDLYNPMTEQVEQFRRSAQGFKQQEMFAQEENLPEQLKFPQQQRLTSDKKPASRQRFTQTSEQHIQHHGITRQQQTQPLQRPLNRILQKYSTPNTNLNHIPEQLIEESLYTQNNVTKKHFPQKPKPSMDSTPKQSDPFDNRTFEEGRIMSEEPNSCSDKKLEIYDIEEESFERVLPFVHVEEERKLVETAKKRKVPKRRAQNAGNGWKNNGNEEMQQNDSEQKNIFDRNSEEHSQKGNQSSIHIDEDLQDDFGYQNNFGSSKKFKSIGN